MNTYWFRLKTSAVHLAVLVFSVISLARCGVNEVLDLSQMEVYARLKRGAVDFITEAPLERLIEFKRLGADAPYYVALCLIENGANTHAISRLMELAFEFGSEQVRDEASAVLLSFVARGFQEFGLKPIEISKNDIYDQEGLNRLLKLSRALLLRYPREDSIRAVAALCLARLGDKAALDALYNQVYETELSPAEKLIIAFANKDDKAVCWPYCLEELFLEGEMDKEKYRVYQLLAVLDPLSLSTKSGHAFAGRIAIYDRWYSEALRRFNYVMSEDEGLFYHYPELLSDLGKAFQYTDPEKGIAYFEKRLLEDAALSIEPRYRLMFYSARLRRQLGDFQMAERHLATALPFAPPGEQRDACAWYLLDTARRLAPLAALEWLSSLAPGWDNPEYFNDFLEDLAADLIVSKNWSALLTVFAMVLPYATPEVTARYAYLLGRATELGYLGQNGALRLSEKDEKTKAAAAASYYYHICVAAEGASWYYRSLASYRLGEFLRPRFSSGKAIISKSENEYAFISGFMDFGLYDEAYARAEALSGTLESAALIELSETFAKAGLADSSIRLASFAYQRDDAKMTRQLWELLYPRAYAKEIRAASRRWNISEALLYGLVRTESYFSSDAVSSAGAIGLSQLLESTAADVASRLRRNGEMDIDETALNLTDPGVNTQLGAWYLADLSRRSFSPFLGLLSYNGGLTRVRRWREAEPEPPLDLFLEMVPFKESREYVKAVLAAAAVYGFLYYGENPETLISSLIETTIPGL